MIRCKSNRNKNNTTIIIIIITIKESEKEKRKKEKKEKKKERKNVLFSSIFVEPLHCRKSIGSQPRLWPNLEGGKKKDRRKVKRE